MKTVWITGAGRGIGAACARRFAAEGWQVALGWCTQKEKTEALAAELNAAAPHTALAVHTDVTDAAGVRAAAAAIEREFGGIGCLVNNAGIAKQQLFTDVTEADWDGMFAVNCKGMYRIAQAVLPGMLHRKSGSIVNISSIWGVVGASCEVPYSAAKGAVITFTQALAKELGPSGIRVNCVAPGVIETDMMAAFSAEDKALLADETPLCRIGRPEDVAAAVVFLAGDDASFITGQTLGVDGGFGR
ncbi:MAG: glucose 1-dehydrogenase [Oscillospiraceae bacterium]|nr:glucose 1-dehydrogenase [Oscillospiraceae bacterium]